MNITPENPIQAAEIVLPCRDFDNTLSFFTKKLGFKIHMIFPADNPATAVISAYGVTLRLQRDDVETSTTLRLLCRHPAGIADGKLELTAPNGTCIQLVEADPPLQLPPIRQTLVITKNNDDAQWITGRAGMRYRDLIPDRQGGRFIASHIQIPDGGPVPDYVHYHNIYFQMIYCYKGWVRVVYEDQGPPFVLQAGDCVLQPPQIRHRVLESSPGLQVIEIGCPALHETCVDHDLQLPTDTVNLERDFGGQRFVYHQAAKARWQPWRIQGFEARDSGIAAATNGLAGVRVARRDGDIIPPMQTNRHDLEFLFLFVLSGTLMLDCENHSAQWLSAGDSCVLPAQLNYSLNNGSDDLELLEVTLPEL